MADNILTLRLVVLVLFGQAAQPVRIDTAAATARHAVASL